MLGLGESRQELFDVLADLLDAGCDFLTLGQYLQPDIKRFLPVDRYLCPEEFDELGRAARAMGFAAGGQRTFRAQQLPRPGDGGELTPLAAPPAEAREVAVARGASWSHPASHSAVLLRALCDSAVHAWPLR